MSTPTPPSSRFVRIAGWCAHHRWQTIVAWIVFVIVAFTIGGAVGTRKIDNFRLPNTESQTAYDVLAAHAPAQNGVTDQLVYVARSGTLKDGALAKRIAASLAAVRKDPAIALAAPLRLAPGARVGVADVTFKGDQQKLKVDDVTRVEKIAFKARDTALQVEHGGPGAELARFSQQGGGFGEVLIGLAVAFLVLLLVFGSLIAALIPLVTAIFALGATFGLVPVISQLVNTPDFASQLAALIGIGVGIDYALIVVTRYRAEHARGTDREAALLIAMDRAGRTVFFAGCTVIIALLGLLLLGLSFLYGAAIAAALAVMLTMLAALTLLPALVARSGDWIDRLHVPLPGQKRRQAVAQASAATEGVSGVSPAWARWTGAVQRRPWVAIVVSLAVLLGLAAPALHMRLGTSDAGLDPAGTTTRKAYDLVAQGFGAGTNGSFLLAVQLAKKGDSAAATKVYDAIKGDPDVGKVVTPTLSKDGAIATIIMFPKSGPQLEATTKLLDRLRDDALPPVERATGAKVYVGGQVASQEDFTSVISSKLPLFVGMVVLLSALLLMMVFRSVLIPLKAAAMNLLSIGAALGCLTLVFQDGHLAGLLGSGTGPIESFVPVMTFAIVFGLSMDYEMFLVSRMREEWVRTGDASTAVRNGVATTGRVITAAAAIMIVVFSAFALGPERVIKEFGLGLAVAVLLDALIIRCLLVPALMQVMSRWAWWTPPWLERSLPHLAIERE
ncbi:MAG TPA: MMPL family transporter [Solirubrobacteraceae bacterium]|jgi:RND superfamily putative drug exporter|nr:MMPL family transporter [Solirubrobacteraceae bacterium]